MQLKFKRWIIFSVLLCRTKGNQKKKNFITISPLLLWMQTVHFELNDLKAEQQTSRQNSIIRESVAFVRGGRWNSKDNFVFLSVLAHFMHPHPTTRKSEKKIGCVFHRFLLFLSPLHRIYFVWNMEKLNSRVANALLLHYVPFKIHCGISRFRHSSYSI